MIDSTWFARDAQVIAKALLGKVLYRRYQSEWLRAKIIETEAYYQSEKASHASLGFTPKRRALFMPPGTIYMYYARGGDSLNFSVAGPGNAVLIKSAVIADEIDGSALKLMQQLNPVKGSDRLRSFSKLCSGQTLLCRSLALQVKEWDQRQLDPNFFYVADAGYQPERIIQTTRLGIPTGRDEYFLYRFIDYQYAARATKNPLAMRNPPRYKILSF